MDNHPCPGWCNTKWRRAERRRVNLGEQHEERVVEVTTAMCDRCWFASMADLLELPELYAALWADYLHAAKPAMDQRVSGSPRGELNIYLDLFDQADHFVDTWDERYRLARGWWRAQRGTVTERARHLAAGGEWIRDKMPDAEELALDITRLARRIRKATKRDVMLIRLKMPCPNCGVKALLRREPYRRPGDPVGVYQDNIRCDKCGLLWNEDEYARAALVLAEQEKAG